MIFKKVTELRLWKTLNDVVIEDFVTDIEKWRKEIMSKGSIVRACQANEDGGYHRLAVGICQQAFEDLKITYLLEAGYDELSTTTIEGINVSSKVLEKWFLSEEYLFLTGYENGSVIIREAKRQAQEILDGKKKYVKQRAS